MRIDKNLASRYGSRTKAADAVERGYVLVNGNKVNPSYEVRDGDRIDFIEPTERYVSNGGYKLSKALRDFNFSVKDMIFADIGASNGGFTDCLFKNGAKKVYCIDVGDSQLDDSLRDKNVVIYDNFNARNLNSTMFVEVLDGAVIDVSFISLTYVLKQVADALKEDKHIIALVKPQFECECRRVGKNGIVKDATVHKNILNKIYNFAQGCGLSVIGVTNAPIIPGKNKEYLFLFKKNSNQSVPVNVLLQNIKL